MALQLLVDEDTQPRRLLQLLLDAGHVVSVSDQDLEGAKDVAVMRRPGVGTSPSDAERMRSP